MAQAKWELWEDEILRKNYSTLGTKIPELSHRTNHSIEARASKLGLRKAQEAWKPHEIEILRQKYGKCGANIPELQHRSKKAIQVKANELGLKRGTCKHMYYWQPWEDELIRKYHSQYGCKIPGLEHRTPGSINARAYALDAVRSRMNWGPEEDELIRARYCEIGADGIAKLLPHKSISSIYRRAHKLGVTKEDGRTWSQDDTAWLIQNYRELGTPECARYLGKTERAVYERAKRLGLVGRDEIIVHGTHYKSVKEASKAYNLSANRVLIELRKGYTSVEEAIDRLSLGVSRGDATQDILAWRSIETEKGCEKAAIAVCKVCNSVMLLKAQEFRGFRHGEMCETHRMPKFVRIPASVCYELSRACGFNLREQGYKTVSGV